MTNIKIGDYIMDMHQGCKGDIGRVVDIYLNKFKEITYKVEWIYTRHRNIVTDDFKPNGIYYTYNSSSQFSKSDLLSYRFKKISREEAFKELI